jgi:hypothetical protein
VGSFPLHLKVGDTLIQKVVHLAPAVFHKCQSARNFHPAGSMRGADPHPRPHRRHLRVDRRQSPASISTH